MTDRPTYLYAIGAPEGPYKIGYTINLIRKLQDVQYGSYVRVAFVYRVEVNPADALSLERDAHSHLKAYHLRGEWFKAPLDAVKQAFDLVVAVKQGFDQVKAAAARGSPVLQINKVR